jgi:hypothetical protein
MLILGVVLVAGAYLAWRIPAGTHGTGKIRDQLLLVTGLVTALIAFQNVFAKKKKKKKKKQ